MKLLKSSLLANRLLAPFFFAMAAAVSGQTIINDTQTAAPPGGTGSAWDFSGATLVIGSGPQAEGALAVPGETTVLAGDLDLGADEATASGILEIDGVNAAFRAEPHAGSVTRIGVYGRGEVLVTNGGFFHTRLSYLGFHPGSEGRVVVSGFGSAWDKGGVSLRVGQEGLGVLEILDGGRVENFTDAFLGNLSHNGGGGVSEVLVSGGGRLTGSGSSRIGNRPGAEGTVTVSGSGSLWSLGSFLHVGSGGHGNLTVENGGAVDIGSSVSVSSGQRAGEEGASGGVEVHGDGSRLTAGSFLSVGRGGSTGELRVADGGLVETESYLRIGEDAGTEGAVELTGAGSRLDVASFTHVGQNGTGLLEVLDGAFFESGGLLYAGRNNGSTGEVRVEGTGALVTAEGLRLGADPSGLPTGGAASLRVAGGGVVNLDGDAIARGSATITLQDGLIAPGGAAGTLYLLDQTTLAGMGTVDGHLRLGDGAVARGEGGRITVHGRLSGSGLLESVTLGGMDLAASEGTVDLRGVDFTATGGPALVSVAIDGPADGLVVFDAGVDFSGSALAVTFPAGPPSADGEYLLFQYSGSGEREPVFASVSTPLGWVLHADGTLRHESGGGIPAVYFADWAAGHGLSGELAAPMANPAGDGFSNLAKFAFGRDPLSITTRLVELSDDNGSIRLRWNRRADDTVTYVIETRSELTAGQWEAVPGADPLVMIPAGVALPDGYERGEWSVPLDGPRAFFRVRAEVAGAVLVDPPPSPESIIHVAGVEDGGIYFEPANLSLSAESGYTVEAFLNGAPFTGGVVTQTGLHDLVARATGPEGGVVERRVEFFVLDPEVRAPHHTIPMELQLVRQARANPHTRPTASADEWFVLGQSHGWPANPFVPVHDLHGFKITDFTVPDDRKIRVVLTDGNHPVEHTGSWGHRGIVNFLTSEEPEAQTLRRLAIFYIYPMVNPDGRYLSSGRNNPELAAAGHSDHNRVWNTGDTFSTIGVLTNAMKIDTGGTADFLLDFHSAGSNFFYSLPEMMDTPLARAITRRDPEVLPRESAGHPGMTRIWSMSEAGLSARVAYTPEFRGAETPQRSLEIGRHYGLAFYDLFTGVSVLAEVADLLDEDIGGAFGEARRGGLEDALGRLLEAAGEDDGLRVLDEIDLVFEAVQAYEEILGLLRSADDLLAVAGLIGAEAESGFGALFQNQVLAWAGALEDLLADADSAAEAVAAAVDALADGVGNFGLIEEAAPFPPVSPQLATAFPLTATWASEADWGDGFLVNTAAGSDGLRAADNPVLSFGGSGDHVVTDFFPSASELGQQFTWEFWKAYRVFANNTGSSGNDGAAPRFYTQITSANGTLRTAVGDVFWNSATLEETDRWYHIAIVFDEGEVRTYVDGTLEDTRPGVAFTGTSSSPLAIGRGFGEARWLNGFSREHRVWTTARSPVELRRDRHRGLTGDEADLIGYWRMNEGSGNTVFDTAAGRHGTIQGAQWVNAAKPGFRLAQPIAFASVPAVTSSRIEWDVSGAAAGVAVRAGVSDSVQTLPDEWLPADNGDSLPGAPPGTNLSGKVLWLKQEIDPVAGSGNPRLTSLSVSID